MVSMRAKFIGAMLSLAGIKKLFLEPDKIEQKIAQMRIKGGAVPTKANASKVDISLDESRGYAVYTLTPKSGSQKDAPHIFYLHGGAYIMDIAAIHWNALVKLSQKLGATITVPIFPLAPESKATEILGAMHALYNEVSRYGAGNITMMGDSAGAGMAVALAGMIRDDGGNLPAKMVLFSPWLDATCSSDEQAEIDSKDKMLAAAGLIAAGDLYRGELPLDDPKVSPLFGDYTGFPPMAIFAGTHDILVVDARRLVKKLQQNGISNFEYHEYDRMFHVWMLMSMPEGKEAMNKAADFIIR